MSEAQIDIDPPAQAPALLQKLQENDEEEGIKRYQTGGFHPVYVGEVYNSKYKVLQKLGYGRYSTVWLVQDKSHSFQKLWAMKVLSAECYGTDTDIFELEILSHLRSGDATHPGYRHMSILEDSFTHQGPNGSHVCLIFKVMGESLSTFRDWFDEGMIPSPLVQRFTTQLVQALDYAHERGVIHTDIQPSNIMIQIPDETTLAISDIPSSIEEQGGEYKIIATQSLREIYFPEGFNMMELSITLSDWGVASFASRHLTEDIQPVLLRAPEVLLKAKWDTGSDIWNLGALAPELVFGQMMFCGRDGEGRYEVKRHLEEMAGLCGKFPKALLEKGQVEVVQEVFDGEGDLKERSGEKVVGFEKRFAGMDAKEKSKFVAFIKRMLALDPKERPTARDLLDEAWLKHDYDEDVSEEQ